MIIAAIILFLTVLTWDVITDYRKFLKNIRIRHTYEAFIRAGLLIPSGVLFTLANVWWSFITVMGMMFFTWWLLFDGIYNTLTNQSWFHTGTTAKLDIMQEDWSTQVKAVVKIGGMLFFIFVYLYIKSETA